MLTRFDYRVAGELKSETAFCYSALIFNRTFVRILKIADADSLRSTSIH